MPGSGREPLIRSTPIIRSYHGESTGSHPNSEVKHHWACSVLRWGTTWESQVSNVFAVLESNPPKFQSPIALGVHPTS